jgi:HEAT repeat protein
MLRFIFLFFGLILIIYTAAYTKETQERTNQRISTEELNNRLIEAFRLSYIAKYTDLVKDNDRSVRRDAAEALGKIGDARAVEPLITALKDKDGILLNTSAAEALGRIGDAHAIEPIVKILKEIDISRVNTVQVALIKFGNSAIEPLIALLNDNNYFVRIRAIQALGMIRHARAVEPLIATLKDNKRDVRENAAEALGKIGDARAVDPLVALLKDNEQDVRSSAAYALGNIGGQRAVQELVSALMSEGIAQAKALQQLNWEPESIPDRVHYAVALKDKSTLINIWEHTRRVLLQDILSNNYREKIIRFVFLLN